MPKPVAQPRVERIRKRRRKIVKKERNRPLFLIVGIILIVCAIVGGIAAALIYKNVLDVLYDQGTTAFVGMLQIEEFVGDLFVWGNKTNATADWLQSSNLSRHLTSAIEKSLELEGFDVTGVSLVNAHSTNRIPVGKESTNLKARITNFDRKGKHREETPSSNTFTLQIAFEVTAKPSENGQIIKHFSKRSIVNFSKILSLRIASEGIPSEMVEFKIDPEFRQQSLSLHQLDSRISKPRVDNTPVYNVNCKTLFSDLQYKYFRAKCPPHCAREQSIVIGGNELIYASISPICKSSIHAGVIPRYGGELEVLMVGKINKIGSPGFKNGVESFPSVWRVKAAKVKIPGPTLLARSSTVEETTNATSNWSEFSHHYLSGRSIEIFQAITQIDELDGVYQEYTTNEAVSQYKYNQVCSKLTMACMSVGLSVDFVNVRGFLTDNSNSNLFVNWTLIGPEDENYNWIKSRGCPDKRIVNRTHDLIMSELKKNHGFIGKEVSLKLLHEVKNYCYNASSNAFKLPAGNNPEINTCRTDILFIHKVSPELFLDNKYFIMKFYSTIFAQIPFTANKYRVGMHLYRGLETNGSNQHYMNAEIGMEDSRTIMSNVVDKYFGRKQTVLNVENKAYDLFDVVTYLQRYSVFFEEDNSVASKLIFIITDEIKYENKNMSMTFRDLKKRGFDVSFLNYKWWEYTVDESRDENSIFKLASVPISPYVLFMKEWANITDILPTIVELLQTQIQCLNVDENNKSVPNTVTEDNIKKNYPILANGNSYTRRPTKGTGMRPYAALSSRADSVPYVFDEFRITEPEEIQAFYMDGKCGLSSFRTDDNIEKNFQFEAEPNTWPWVVTIAKQSLFGILTNICGGVLIAHGWVITSARCLAADIAYSNVTVLIGYHDFNGKERNDVSYRYKVRVSFIHPKYHISTSDEFKIQHDLMLLELDRPVSFSFDDFFQTGVVCLPNPDVVPKLDKRCYVVGWGQYFNSNQSKIMQQGRFKISEPKLCYAKWYSVGYNINKQICDDGYPIAPDILSCRGDIGNALVCEENERWVLYGISSYGDRGCGDGLGNVFSLVPSYLTWICCIIRPKIGPCLNTKCTMS